MPVMKAQEKGQMGRSVQSWVIGHVVEDRRVVETGGKTQTTAGIESEYDCKPNIKAMSCERNGMAVTIARHFAPSL